MLDKIFYLIMMSISIPYFSEYNNIVINYDL